MRYEGSKYKIRSLKDTATLIREELKEKCRTALGLWLTHRAQKVKIHPTLLRQGGKG